MVFPVVVVVIVVVGIVVVVALFFALVFFQSRDSERKAQLLARQLKQARSQLAQSQQALTASLEENRSLLQDASRAEEQRATLSAEQAQKHRECEESRRQVSGV